MDGQYYGQQQPFQQNPPRTEAFDAPMDAMPPGGSTPFGDPRSNAATDARRLLSVYPFANATPTAHVARHLGTINLSSQTAAFTDSLNQSMYGEQLAPFFASSHENGNGDIWGRDGQKALRAIAEHEHSRYGAHTYHGTPEQTWANATPAIHPGTGYSANPFPNMLLQHSDPMVLPPNIAPRPRPLPSDSSFLYPHSQTTTPPLSQSPTPSQTPSKEASREFFDNFLASTSAQIHPTHARPPLSQSSSTSSLPTPRQSQNGFNGAPFHVVQRAKSFVLPPPVSSPDPLNALPVTPMKRKSTTRLESPTLKRSASANLSPLTTLTPSSQVPDTPDDGSTSSTLQSSVIPTTPPKAVSESPTARRPPKLTAYIDIPLRKPFSPTSSGLRSIQNRGSIDDDLGGFGTPSPLKSSAVRQSTGLRDERPPLAKLTDILEDVFDAEDSLDPSAFEDPNNMASHEYFSPLSTSPNAPLLSSDFMTKFTRVVKKLSVSQSQRKRKSFAVTRSPNSRDDTKGGTSDIDATMLSRIIRMLTRSIKMGEDIDIGTSFPRSKTSNEAPPSPTKGSPTKAQGSTFLEAELDELSEEEEAKLDRNMRALREALIGAEACLSLLTSDQLPKQLYNEETISACHACVKAALDGVIYPMMEAFSPSPSTSYGRLLLNLCAPHGPLRTQAREIYRCVSLIFPLFNNLISISTMSDAIVIQLVFLSVTPFFVSDSSDSDDLGGKKDKKSKKSTLNAESVLDAHNAMVVLQVHALALLRNIFACHGDQRSWIIEEILSSLSKLSDSKLKGYRFRLRDGRSIHIVSALLLQLIQTSAHDVRAEAQRVNLKRRESTVLRHQDNDQSDSGSPQEASALEPDSEEIRLYLNGLDSATKASKTILTFLTKRSSKTKSAKTSNDAEYRAIFDYLLSDLLTVLHSPEWPGAAFVLNMISRYMISAVDDQKNNAEANALKSLALDHLGLVAAKLRSTTLKVKQQDLEPRLREPLEEIVKRGDVSAFQDLMKVRGEILNYLSKRATDDQACDSARELSAALWGQKIALLLRDFPEDSLGTSQLPLFAQLKASLRDVWSEGSYDVFDSASIQEEARVNNLSQALGVTQSLGGLSDAILNVVLAASDSTVVSLRTKALRALGQIVTSDPEVLSNAKVKHTIEGHLMDSSPAVRDTTIELVGRYIVQMPSLAEYYYDKIAARIVDTGLGVRKRVIKLLKTIYEQYPDVQRRSYIALHLATRVMDEDDTVKDLAVKTMEELWFGDIKEDAIKFKTGTEPPSEYDCKVAFAARVTVVMNTIGDVALPKRQFVDDLLHAVTAEKPGKDFRSIQARYTQICDAFIDALVDGPSEESELNVNRCVRSLYYFCSANPSIISSSKASTLLPYLKNTSNDEIPVCEFLLKIFQICIPRMPKTSKQFAVELQQVLQPMVLRPNLQGGLSFLQEVIGSLCAVVRHLTQDYPSLIGLLKSCLGRLRTYLKQTGEQLMQPTSIRPMLLIMPIVALLTQNCDFDKVREEHPKFTELVDQINKDSITRYVYELLLAFYRKLSDSAMKNKIILYLGFLFKSYPGLMLENTSSLIMDEIFASGDVLGRGNLLKVLDAFLLDDIAKHTAAEKATQASKAPKQDVDMGELVGNTLVFADTGVSTAIAQRYLHPILDAAVSTDESEQVPAFNLLGSIIKQGLAHPIESMPALVSLETSRENGISERAAGLHSILYAKHASLVNTRFLDCAKASFGYQRRLLDAAIREKKLPEGSIVMGYRSDHRSLFHPWYSLVREKRPLRLEFLKSIIRALDIDTHVQHSAEDVELTRYIAECVATLDYKTIEEVLTVIHHSRNVLSVAGSSVMESWTPSAAEQLNTDIAMDTVPEIADQPNQPENGSPSPQELSLYRMSIRVGLLLLLKSYLKTLYGLSEEKCAKWVPGKKSALGDKPAAKKHQNTITWDRIPDSTSHSVTYGDYNSQKRQFLTLWQEDGATAEPTSDIE